MVALGRGERRAGLWALAPWLSQCCQESSWLALRPSTKGLGCCWGFLSSGKPNCFRLFTQGVTQAA